MTDACQSYFECVIETHDGLDSEDIALGLVHDISETLSTVAMGPIILVVVSLLLPKILS